MTRQDGSRRDDQLDILDRATTVSFASQAMRVPVSVVEPAKHEEKISVFWRVFGGTILSIAALVAIQAYQAQASNIHELRSDQNRLREMASDFVKKDEFATRTTSMWNRLQELQNLSATVTVAGNRLTAIEAKAEHLEKDRKDIQTSIVQLTGLRDKIGQLEEHKKIAEQDHKDVLALQAAVQHLRDKDLIMERKLLDAEAERKELTRELQALRERLAKLEGQQQTPPPAIGKAGWRSEYRN